MTRRTLLATMPASLFGWRVHMLARHECANGGMLSLLLRGEAWRLTERERELVDWIAEKMRELEPAVMQRRLPKA